MQLDFIDKAVIAGIGVALSAGPLGSIIIWRRMANFSDTLSHSMLLGVCLAFWLNIHIYFGLGGICIIVAGLLLSFSRQNKLPNDTVLSILAQSMLALGLILASGLKGLRFDLLGYLYGDILAVETQDLFVVFAVDLVVISILCTFWRSILSLMVHEDLAAVEGISINAIKWILTLLMAMVFAVAVKLVGVLLITALLIIPASSARQLVKTPEQMAIIASIMAMISVCSGITFSVYIDWPAGPSIVCGAVALFLICLSVNKIRRSR